MKITCNWTWGGGGPSLREEKKKKKELNFSL